MTNLTGLDELKQFFLLDSDFDDGEAAGALELIADFCNPERDYSPQRRPLDLESRMRAAVECWRAYNGCMETTPQRINAGLFRVPRSLEACFKDVVEANLSPMKQRKLSDYLRKLLPPNVPFDLQRTLYWVAAVRIAGEKRDFSPLLRLWLDDEHRTPPAGFDECGQLHYMTA